MSAYAVPTALTAPAPAAGRAPTCSASQPASPFAPSSDFIASRRALLGAIPSTKRPALRRAPAHPPNVAISATAVATQQQPPPAVDWRAALRPGSVVEVWAQGELRFALVTSPYAKGVLARLVTVSADGCAASSEVKVSFGEIVSVWPDALCHPNSDGDATALLVGDVETGLRLLKTSQPRRLDTTPAYDKLRARRTTAVSQELSRLLFPMNSAGNREQNATATVATAILLAADTIRFKRAGPGLGWRALPPSVAVARGRCSFVDACKAILEQRESGNVKRVAAWSREQLEILRDLEIHAASGSVAKGTAATALEALGYESSDDGAAKLLLDIEYWATGSVEKHGGGTTLAKDANRARTPRAGLNGSADGKGPERRKGAGGVKNQDVRDWTFPPEILADARELRTSARERRVSNFRSKGYSSGLKRRSLLRGEDGRPLRAYCIDDKSSRFLDDALSVEKLNGNVVRASVHITDVDQVVKSGSPIDDLARERGQSLYLPLKPLHMLPAAAMEAASFSSSLPTEAITVRVDYDLKNQVILNWEVFPSIIPAVRRFNYDQFDLAILKGAEGAQIPEEDSVNLRLLATVAPRLAEILDQRRNRRSKTNGDGNEQGFEREDHESDAIAAVRLVRKSDGSSSNGTVKVAKVVNFQSSSAHIAVGDILTSAGALIRQFAKENRAYLPETKAASSYAARCGTAPLRRYADLAIQRQVKCVLFGRQPAGRRRMEELRIWLSKRHVAGERTLAERRRNALFDSLSSHCSQQCAVAGTTHAVVKGQVRNIAVTKKGKIKVDVTLDGTGLATFASLSGRIREQIEDICVGASGDVYSARGTGGEGGAPPVATENLLQRAQRILPKKAKVSVQIVDVNTSAQQIQASVVDVHMR